MTNTADVPAPPPPVAGAGVTGRRVYDVRHQRVGTISAVVEDQRGTPAWAVVLPGPQRAAHYVPLAGARATADGDVVVPYAREQVHAARKVRPAEAIDGALARELAQHYALDGW